jgi:hypothetical protein
VSGGADKEDELNEIKLDMKTEWRRDVWLTKMKELRVNVSVEAAIKLGQQDAKQTIIGDGVKGLTSEMIKNWNERQKAVVDKVMREKVMTKRELNVYVESSNIKKSILQMEKGDKVEVTNSFGRYSQLKDKLSDVKRLERMKLVTYDLWLKQNAPQYWNAITKSNLTRLDAEMWFLGDIPTEVSSFNPMISDRFRATIANSVILGKIPKGRLLDVWARVNRYVLREAEMSVGVSELYSW